MVIANLEIATGGLQEVLAAWNWDPTVITGLGLLGGLYAVGLIRSRGRRARLFPWWRLLCFYTGLLSLFVALISPIDALSERLFFMHMVQHSVLTMIGAPLILLGAPFIPIIRGLPRPVRRRVLAPLARIAALRRALSFLTRAQVSFPLYFGSIWAWHAPAIYSLALENGLLHIVQHSWFLGTAFLFWWVIIDPVPFPPRIGYGVRMLYLFAAATPNAALGAFLTFSLKPWYPFYMQGMQLWGVSPMVDQRLGGIIMWLPGWMMYLLAICIVYFIMMGEEERVIRSRAAQREGGQ